MTAEEKETTIHKVYFDPAGYGSIQHTYRDAKQYDKRITLNDVRQWFHKNIEKTKQLKGSNSFVPPYPFYEFQIDLFFIEDLENQRFKVGLMCIDVFSKFVAVIPLMSKSEGDLLSGMMEAIVKMGGKPEIIYTDDEGALRTKVVFNYFKEKNIQHIITRTHAHFAERMIRTFKSMLYKRIDNGKKENPQWHDYIYQILLTYNHRMIHSATGVSPKDALLKDKEVDVKLRMENHAKKNRKYPKLGVGDKVKIYTKRKKGEKRTEACFRTNPLHHRRY